MTIRSTAFEKVEGGSGSAAMEKVECEVPVAACVSACLIIDDSPACALDSRSITDAPTADSPDCQRTGCCTVQVGV